MCVASKLEWRLEMSEPLTEIINGRGLRTVLMKCVDVDKRLVPYVAVLLGSKVASGADVSFAA